MYLSEIEERLLSVNESGKSYPNLKKNKRDALHSLMSDDELIIKPADKGSAVVVWSKYDYLLEAKSQLNNTKVYENWNGNPLQKLNTEIKSVLRDILNRKEINKKIMDYLLIKRPQLGRFYLLPKTHKRKQIMVLEQKIFLLFSTVPHVLEDIQDFLFCLM